jgi:hypothetical protein
LDKSDPSTLPPPCRSGASTCPSTSSPTPPLPPMFSSCMTLLATPSRQALRGTARYRLLMCAVLCGTASDWHRLPPAAATPAACRYTCFVPLPTPPHRRPLTAPFLSPSLAPPCCCRALPPSWQPWCPACVSTPSWPASWHRPSPLQTTSTQVGRAGAGGRAGLPSADGWLDGRLRLSCVGSRPCLHLPTHSPCRVGSIVIPTALPHCPSPLSTLPPLTAYPHVLPTPTCPVPPLLSAFLALPAEWVRSYSSAEYLRLPAKAESVLDETADSEPVGERGGGLQQGSAGGWVGICEGQV